MSGTDDGEKEVAVHPAEEGRLMRLPPTREERDDAMTVIAEALESIWGSRCLQRDGGCPTCAAWAIFDTLDQMADASYLEPARKRRKTKT